MLQCIYVSLRKVEIVQLYVTVLTTNGTIIIKYIAGETNLDPRLKDVVYI